MLKFFAALAAIMLVGCSDPVSTGSYSSVGGYRASSSSAAVSSSSAAAVVSLPPVSVALTYTATSGTQSGSFAIGYSLNNLGPRQVRVVSANYVIYGSAGGALTDVVETYDDLSLEWIPSMWRGSYALRGYSARYIPYSYSFTITFVDDYGTMETYTYTGRFTTVLARTSAKETR